MTDVKLAIAELKGIPTESALVEMLCERVLTVTFLKLDGDQRVMTCTKNTAIIPEQHLPKTSKPGKPGTINVWDTNAQGWRSFRYDRVSAVTEVVDNSVDS
jgi:hypothetical protein